MDLERTGQSRRRLGIGRNGQRKRGRFYHESSYLGMAAAECERRNNGGGKFDPITGQAAWYDLRIAIRPFTPAETKKRQEQIAAAAMLADEKLARPLNYAAHRAVHLLRPLRDVLGKR